MYKVSGFRAPNHRSKVLLEQILKLAESNGTTEVTMVDDLQVVEVDGSIRPWTKSIS